NTALAETRFQSALKVVNELARVLGGDSDALGLHPDGKDGPDKKGVAEPIKIKERIDTNSDKAADPDLTKAEIIEEATKLVAPELAKSVAAHVEKAFEP